MIGASAGGGNPRNILFDRHLVEAKLHGALDAVRPLAIVGVAVVRVHQRAAHDARLRRGGVWRCPEQRGQCDGRGPETPEPGPP